MNNVNYEIQESQSRDYNVGDIFSDTDFKNYYILSKLFSNVYVCISLHTGECWSKSSPSLTTAIEGLEYVDSDLNIEIYKR